MRMNSSRNGSAMILAVVVVILVAGLGGAFWSMSIHSAKNSQRLTDEAEVQMICDAGLEMARAALVAWRNNDPYKKEGDAIPTPEPTKYAWNKIFQHCLNVEAAQAGMGINASADVIREDALKRFKGTVAWAYGTDQTNYNIQTANHTVFGMTDKTSTLIDSCISDLFCVNRRYGQGAFHLSLRNNTPEEYGHGDGIDNSRPPSGDPWRFDKQQTQVNLDGTSTTLYPGDPINGFSGTTSPVIDGDGSAVLTVTATLPNGTVRQIEVFLAFPFTGGGPVNAIQDNGDIKMQGDFKILGQLGKVHANGNITGNGSNGSQISQGVTASGDASSFGMNGTQPPQGIKSGQPPVDIQPVDMEKFRDPADTKYRDVRENMFELKKDGSWRKWTSNTPGTWNTSGAPSGLKYMANNQQEPWQRQTGNNAGTIADATYFIEGNFSMSGNDTTPIPMTILATGSVDMQGSAMYTSATNKNPSSSGYNLPLEQLIIAGADVRLRGTATSGLNYTGAIFANEQVAISGTFNMNGSITAANVTDSPYSAVTSNTSVAPDLTVQGNPTIIYNGGGSLIKNETDHVNVRGIHRTR